MKTRILALTLIVALTSAIVCAGDNSAGGVSTEEDFAFIISPGGYASGISDLDATLGQGDYDIVWFFVLGAGNLNLQVEDCCIMGDIMIALGDLIIGGPASYMDWAISPDIISIDVACADFALGYLIIAYYDAPGGFPAGYEWRASMGGGGDCVVGTWDWWYDWECDGAPNMATVWIYDDGTWDNSEGYSGTYTLVGDQLTLFFPSGTTYWGTVDRGCTYMSGTMESFAGATGCWWADKTAVPSTEASQDDSGIDSAGN